MEQLLVEKLRQKKAPPPVEPEENPPALAAEDGQRGFICQTKLSPRLRVYAHAADEAVQKYRTIYELHESRPVECVEG